jgi:hypothetical protein
MGFSKRSKTFDRKSRKSGDEAKRFNLILIENKLSKKQCFHSTLLVSKFSFDTGKVSCLMVCQRLRAKQFLVGGC